MEKLEAKGEKQLKRYFYEQRKEVLKNLGSLLKSKKSLVDFLIIDFINEVKKLQDIEYEILDRATSYTQEFYKNYYGGFGIVIEPLKPEYIDSMPLRIKTIPKQILQNIIKQLESTLRDGIAAGESIGDLQKRVRAVYNMASNRALTIARTESGFAIGEARNKLFKKAKVKKIKWLTAEDERVRKTHQLVDGEIREFGQKFSNGLRYPHDTLAPPGEVINCRCLAIPVDEFDVREAEERNRLANMTPEEFKKDLLDIVDIEKHGIYNNTQSYYRRLEHQLEGLEDKLQVAPEFNAVPKLLKKKGVKVVMDFEPKNDANMGLYSSWRKEVRIFLNRTKTAKWTIQTLFHESFHALTIDMDIKKEVVEDMKKELKDWLLKYAGKKNEDYIDLLIRDMEKYTYKYNNNNDNGALLFSLIEGLRNEVTGIEKAYWVFRVNYAFTNFTELVAEIPAMKVMGWIKEGGMLDDLSKRVFDVVRDNSLQE